MRRTQVRSTCPGHRPPKRAPIQLLTEAEVDTLLSGNEILPYVLIERARFRTRFEASTSHDPRLRRVIRVVTWNRDRSPALPMSQVGGSSGGDDDVDSGRQPTRSSSLDPFADLGVISRFFSPSDSSASLLAATGSGGGSGGVGGGTAVPSPATSALSSLSGVLIRESGGLSGGASGTLADASTTPASAAALATALVEGAGTEYRALDALRAAYADGSPQGSRVGLLQTPHGLLDLGGYELASPRLFALARRTPHLSRCAA